ncbi:mCG140651, partial [Mus musculus]
THPKCPSIDQWINTCGMSRVDYCSATNRNEALTQATIPEIEWQQPDTKHFTWQEVSPTGTATNGAARALRTVEHD